MRGAALLTPPGAAPSDSAYDTLVKTTMSGTMLYFKGLKSGNMILDDIEGLGMEIGVGDLTEFENEATLPNGDQTLVIRGDLDAEAKAVTQVALPTLSPVDPLNVGDVAGNHAWAMSTWLKIPDPSGGTYGQHMFGCSTGLMSAIANNTKNDDAVLVFYVFGLGSYRLFRDPLNNYVPGTAALQVLQPQLGINTYSNKWIMLTANVSAIVGGLITMDLYIDSFATAYASDTADAAGASGSYDVNRALHIGCLRAAGTGWAAAWRMAKWAFHDHALTLAERQAMVQAMRGPVSFSDNFNRADGGAANDDWTITLSSGLVIASNKLTRTSSPTTAAALGYYADHGTPDMYAECVVHQGGTFCGPIVRHAPYPTGNITGAYSGGYEGTIGSGAGRWEIRQGSTTVLASGSNGVNAPTYPATIRLEAVTNGSGNVELTLKCNGVTRLTYTDSGGSKNTTHRSAGIKLQGKTGENGLVDDFASGSL